MRTWRVLGLLAVVACDSTPFDSIDPDDPLVGIWDPVDNDGARLSTRQYTYWSFGADGRYRGERLDPDGVSYLMESGPWGRVDDDTIVHCVSSCGDRVEWPVRIDPTAPSPVMLLDGAIAQDGVWHFTRTGSCTQHGTSYTTHDSLDIHDDGAATAIMQFCTGNPGGPSTATCAATATATSLGFELTFPVSCALPSNPWGTSYVRVRDMLASVGYVRR